MSSLILKNSRRFCFVVLLRFYALGPNGQGGTDCASETSWSDVPGSLVKVQGQPILPSGCATWLRHSTPAVDVTHPQPFTQPNHVMHGP